MKKLRLGTRSSELALFQANLTYKAIKRVDPSLDVEIVKIVSDGDTDPRELRDIGERGIFAARLERELEAGTIDAAVHSSKDLQLEDHPNLVLSAWLKREDPRDSIISFYDSFSLEGITKNVTIATGSARRTASLRTINPLITPSPIRGNVHTRIKLAKERNHDAIMLAYAGLKRLGITNQDLSITPISIDMVVPEAGQGAIVIQSRSTICDKTGFNWSLIDDLDTRKEVNVERSIATLLGGGCTRPVGVNFNLSTNLLYVFYSTDVDEPGKVINIKVDEDHLSSSVEKDGLLYKMVVDALGSEITP